MCGFLMNNLAGVEETWLVEHCIGCRRAVFAGALHLTWPTFLIPHMNIYDGFQFVQVELAWQVYSHRQDSQSTLCAQPDGAGAEEKREWLAQCKRAAAEKAAQARNGGT